MNIKPIRTESDYKHALADLEHVFDAPKGTSENDLAEILITLIDKYESEHYPIEAPDPIEAIKIRMAEMDLHQKDLMSFIGTKSRGTISNILNRRRPLTLPVIRAIGPKLGLSFDVLVKEYKMG
ncbi:MAG: transcriptional regulator [Cyclobacteriaceae bacterium]